MIQLKLFELQELLLTEIFLFQLFQIKKTGCIFFSW